MKRIAGLPVPPPGLARFHSDQDISKTWAEFGSFEAGRAKRELTAELTARQHGLCAYCEINLVPNDTSLEHFVPQSDSMWGATLACDHRNLLAVCRGGGNAMFGPGSLQPDPTRFLPPVRENLSCDAAKDNRPATEFLDPRTLPIQPVLVQVNEDGSLVVDPTACGQVGVPETAVSDHIRGLGLNVGRLSNLRAAVRTELIIAFLEFATLPPQQTDEHLIAMAESRLLPDPVGVLARFFPTARSFFGPVAETILSRPPQSWI
jgi:uncharacterized protein (TIGR02646 family)